MPPRRDGMEDSGQQTGIDFAANRLNYFNYDTGRVTATRRFASYWTVTGRRWYSEGVFTATKNDATD